MEASFSSRYLFILLFNESLFFKKEITISAFCSYSMSWIRVCTSRSILAYSCASWSYLFFGLFPEVYFFFPGPFFFFCSTSFLPRCPRYIFWILIVASRISSSGFRNSSPMSCSFSQPRWYLPCFCCSTCFIS